MQTERSNIINAKPTSLRFKWRQLDNSKSILQSHIRDEAATADTIFSQSQKGKREHPICREGQYLQENNPPGTSYPAKTEKNRNPAK